MHENVVRRHWMVRGFRFNIIERIHWLPSGAISLFSCESLDGLIHDELRELTLGGALQAIEESLPEWIERTRAGGRETPPYDPAGRVEELSPPS